MYIYIYDSFVNTKRYESALRRIETRLTDLGLNGKIIRLGAMKNAQDSIQDEIRRGATTVVAVGDNRTFSLVMNALAASISRYMPGQSVPFGLIPVKKSSIDVASALGIGPIEEACDILSARRIEKLDLGLANDVFFLTEAVIPTKGTSIEIDHSYTIEINETGVISVVNLPVTRIGLPKNIAADPQDKALDLCVRTTAGRKYLHLPQRHSGPSVFSFNKLLIKNKNRPLTVDAAIKITTPAEICLATHRIPIIVGKKRGF